MAQCTTLSAFQLQPASAILGTAAGRFRDGELDLAVATCDELTLHAVDGDGELRRIAAIELPGRLTALLGVARPPHARSAVGDVLLAATAALQLLAIAWDAHEGRLRVLAQSPLHLQSSEADASEPYARPDAALLAACPVPAGGPSNAALAVPACLVAAAVRQHRIHTLLLAWVADGLQASVVCAHAMDGDAPAGADQGGLNILSLCTVPACTAARAAASEALGSLAFLTTSATNGTRQLVARPIDAFLGRSEPAGGVTTEDERLAGLHPTTSLLAPWGEGSLLFISQAAATEAVLGRGISRGQGVRLELAGAPTCCAALDLGRALAVGDASGGITLLLAVPDGTAAAGSSLVACKLHCERPPCLPTTLAPLALGSDGGGECLLFVGSWAAPSQLLRLQGWAEGQAQAQAVAAHELPGADCLAPIHDAAALQDGAGGEGSLLLACGCAPAGSVCLAQMAAGLVPSVVDPTKLQHRPRLLPVAASGGQGDAFLGLSFGSAGHTTLLDVRGGSAREARPPGLALEQPSLLLARLPGGRLLQVTPEEVRVAGDPDAAPDASPEAGPAGGPQLAWQAPARLSHAACCGAAAAVASGSCVWLLGLGGAAVEASQPLRLPHQVSALALLDAGGTQERVGLWLAVGQWQSNEVHLYCLALGPPTGAPAAVLSLACGQPRSIALARFPAAGPVLFVGTSDGSLTFRSMQVVSGSAGIQLGPPRCVRVGLGGVDLEWLPPQPDGAPACVFAAADRSLLVRELPEAAKGIAGDEAEADPLAGLEAVRVQGAEGAGSSCRLHAPAMPGGRAWVSRGGRLTFGTLDWQARLRCRRQVIGHTPQRLLHDPASGTVLVLADDGSGGSWLHLLQAGSLRPLSRVALAGQQGRALAWARLPTAAAQGECARRYAVLAAAATGPDANGLVRERSMLHVLEVAAAPAGAAGAEVIVHGSAEISSPCFSLAAVEQPPAPPPSEAAGSSSSPGPAGSGASAAADAVDRQADGQLLVAGCQDGCQLLRVTVQPVVEQGRAFILEAAGRVARGACQPAEAGDTEGSSRDPRWRECVRVECLSRVEAGSGGCVAHLAAHGSQAAALELLGGLSLLRPAPRPPQLGAGLALRQTSTLTIALTPAPAALSAAAFLDASHCVGGLFPGGLVICSRDHAAEEAAEQAYLQEVKEAAEAAAGRSALASKQPRVQPLWLLCHHAELWETPTALCVGRLGIRPSRGEQAAEAAPEDSAEEGRTWPPLLYATKEGGVGLVQPWSLDEAEVLWSTSHNGAIAPVAGSERARRLLYKCESESSPEIAAELAGGRGRAVVSRNRVQSLLRTVRSCQRGC